MAGKQEEIYFNIPFEIKNPVQERIAKAFSLFDREGIKVAQAKDVGPILRSLGCVPSAADVREVVKETEFKDHPGEVHISKFVRHVEKIINDQKLKPASEKILVQAFKLLDPEDDGFIDSENFRKLMMEVGDELTQFELESLMKSAIDPIDGKVHYETYIRQLIYEPDDSIYKLAALKN